MTYRMNDKDHKSTHLAFQYIKRNINRALRKQGLKKVSEQDVDEALDVLMEGLDKLDAQKVWIDGEYRQALLLTLLSEIIFNNVWRVEERDGPDPIEQALKNKYESKLVH